MTEPSFFKVGLNYQEDKSILAGQTNAEFRAASKAYFKKIKSPNAPFPIRIMTRAQPMSIPYPFIVGDSDINGYFGTNYQMAKDFASDPDFDVIFNINSGPLTKDSWALSRQSCLVFTQLVKDEGVKMEISIANELQDVYGIQYVGSTITRSGTTATLTVVSPFQTHVGDVITMYNCSPSNWNGQYTITGVIDSKNMTFDVPNTMSSTATGSTYSVSLQELNQYMKDLAHDMHQINPNQKVSIGEFNKVINGVGGVQDLIDNGIGELDYVSMHTYPNSFKAKLPSVEASFLAAYGDRAYISEFNGDSGNNTGQWNFERGENTMRDIYDNINATGVKRAIIWSWDTNLQQHNANGTFHRTWGVLVNNNGRIPINAQNNGSKRDFIS